MSNRYLIKYKKYKSKYLEAKNTLSHGGASLSPPDRVQAAMMVMMEGLRMARNIAPPEVKKDVNYLIGKVTNALRKSKDEEQSVKNQALLAKMEEDGIKIGLSQQQLGNVQVFFALGFKPGDKVNGKVLELVNGTDAKIDKYQDLIHPDSYEKGSPQEIENFLRGIVEHSNDIIDNEAKTLTDPKELKELDDLKIVITATINKIKETNTNKITDRALIEYAKEKADTELPEPDPEPSY